MSWFDYLKSSGFFDPDQNPKPVASERGTNIPHWEALDYLEKLSTKFAEGKELAFVPAVIDIIRNISEHPIDNYHTWYRLINILAKIPTELIPIELLGFMPVWTTSQYDTSIVTMALAETLLGHTINQEQTTPYALAFSSNLLANLLEIRPKWNIDGVQRADTRNYYSPYDLYNLTQSLLETDNFGLIVKQFGPDQMIVLIDKINILLRDQIATVELRNAEISYTLKAIPIDIDILILVFESKDTETTCFEELTKNYIDLEAGWETAYFSKIFDNLNITEESRTYAQKRISFTLTNDFESLLGLEPISDLQDTQTVGNPALNAFALILRNWLKAWAVSEPKKARAVLKLLTEKKRYQLPFFKRFVIYISGKNWPELKNFFWETISEKNNDTAFSVDIYKVELSETLKEVKFQLDNQDVQRLKAIFEKGPTGERHYSASPDAWRYRWLDALEGSQEFSGDLTTVSSKFNKKPDFSTDGRVNIRVGHVSPLSKEELAAMSPLDIANMLSTFKSTGAWDDPTEDGLADILSQVVEENPEPFAVEIKSFLNTNYRYAYDLLFGFNKALRKGKTFAWFKILDFCLTYISSEPFQNKSLQSDEDPRATKEWIYGEVANLISERCKGEMDEFENEELLLAEKIVIFLCTKLNASTVSDQDTIYKDYIMHSLNSTQGKTLRAVLDCSLKDARDRNMPELNAGVWKESLKASFSDTLDKEIIDGYILQGMYLPQFMFLDNQWLRAQIVKNLSLDFNEWAAFMGGIGFGKPISGDYYPIMHPHYARAVEINYVDTHYNSGILRHLLAFYFWDYESTFEQSLLFKALINPAPKLISQLIKLVSQQKPSMKELEESEYVRLLNKIVRIWQLILEKFEVIEPEAKTDHRQLGFFIDFIRPSDLNQVTTELISKTILRLKDQGSFFLLKQLLKLCEPRNAEFVGKLVKQINIAYNFDNKSLEELVEFLYQNNQNDAANEVISKLTIRGMDFLKPIYFKYNPE